MKRCCKTCRYWDVHSTDMLLGDCQAPGDHRYSRVPMETTDKRGKVWRSMACLDSFGKEETRPNFVCGVWQSGQTETV